VMTTMYGQADIGFVPEGGTVNYPPQITSTAVTAATAGSLYQYDVNATDANGDTVTFSLVTYPSGMSINASTGLIAWTPLSSQTGSQSVSVKAADGKGGEATQNYTITVSSVITGEQTPWKSNQNGTLGQNVAYNYTMGYHFTPQKNGQITKLGGYFNGTKTVYLWNKATGALLAQATVTSANAWSYASITPVNVTAGTTYTVAVYVASSGGSYRSGISTLPKIYGDVRIDGSTYLSGNGRPTNAVMTTMYGQADICFVASN
jgi:hypothetical protein